MTENELRLYHLIETAAPGQWRPVGRERASLERKYRALMVEQRRAERAALKTEKAARKAETLLLRFDRMRERDAKRAARDIKTEFASFFRACKNKPEPKPKAPKNPKAIRFPKMTILPSGYFTGELFAWAA